MRWLSLVAIVPIVAAAVLVAAMTSAPGREPVAPTSRCDRDATNGAELAQQFEAATAGQAICLAAGDYGAFSAGRKPGVVTVRARDGAHVTMSLDLNSTVNVHVEGMTVTSAEIAGAARNVTIARSRFTGPAVVRADQLANANIRLERNVHENIDVCAKCFAGRVHVTGDSGQPSGVVVARSIFRGGSSDGVRADANGVVIEGNEFSGLAGRGESHTDPIQIYGGTRVVIRGNFFHDNAVAAQIVMANGGAHNVVEDNVIGGAGYTWAMIWNADDGSVIRHNTFADGACDAGVRCGTISLAGSPPGPARPTVIRDNVLTTVGSDGQGAGFVAEHNLVALPTPGRANVTGAPPMLGRPRRTTGTVPHPGHAGRERVRRREPGYPLTQPISGLNDVEAISGARYSCSPGPPGPVLVAHAARDRDHDRLPDRWERRYGLSTKHPSARGDRDRDGLSNRREYRLHTNPRRRDTDRDGVSDGAEVMRYKTNPRKRDTDGDGVSDGDELRGGQPSPVTPAPVAGFASPATTGVPAGWTPAQTRTSDLRITEPGAVIEDVLLQNADIVVEAPNVTIRRTKLQGGSITNFTGSPCLPGLVIEDTTIEPEPGQQFSSNTEGVVEVGGYTARRVKIWRRSEGFRSGADCGPVHIEDSFVSIATPEGTCSHADGIQGAGAPWTTMVNSTIDFREVGCGTAPFFFPQGQGNDGVTIDRLLVMGGGFPFRLGTRGTVAAEDRGSLLGVRPDHGQLPDAVLVGREHRDHHARLPGRPHAAPAAV